MGYIARGDRYFPRALARGKYRSPRAIYPIFPIDTVNFLIIYHGAKYRRHSAQKMPKSVQNSDFSFKILKIFRKIKIFQKKYDFSKFEPKIKF